MIDPARSAHEFEVAEHTIRAFVWKILHDTSLVDPRAVIESATKGYEALSVLRRETREMRDELERLRAERDRALGLLT